MRRWTALLLLAACAPAKVYTDDPMDGGGSGDGGSGGDGGGDGGTDGGSDGGTDGGGDGGGGATADGFSLELDDEVVTMVRASWIDSGADEVWVEYRFDGGDWATAPSVSAASAVLLGIPDQALVEALLVQVVDGVESRGEVVSIETGTLPSWLLLPSVEAFEPSLADAAPFAMVSIAGGDNYTFQGPWQLMIFNREGRIVWYRQLDDEMSSFYAQAARDGTHIWYDAADIFGLGRDDPHVIRTTLDGRWSERIELDELGQAVDEGPDGSFFYEKRASRGNTVALMQVDALGEVSTIWDCSDWIGDLGKSYYDCYMNTTNWTEERNTVLTSMFYSNTVFEIDLDTGLPIRQMGQIDEGDPYEFSPRSSMFDYQHYPNYTDEGTLLVSTHQPGVSGKQYAAEYEVDDETKTLTRIWFYESTDIWATQVGEALRLRNGNTLQGYGQDGGVREVTADGEEAWFVLWEKDNQGYRAMGHTELIDDLYALNRGPE